MKKARVIYTGFFHYLEHEKTLQNHVGYSADREKHQIWIEDKKSIGLRLNLLKQNH